MLNKNWIEELADKWVENSENAIADFIGFCEGDVTIKDIDKHIKTYKDEVKILVKSHRRAVLIRDINYDWVKHILNLSHKLIAINIWEGKKTLEEIFDNLSAFDREEFIIYVNKDYKDVVSYLKDEQRK